MLVVVAVDIGEADECKLVAVADDADNSNVVASAVIDDRAQN